MKLIKTTIVVLLVAQLSVSCNRTKTTPDDTVLVDKTFDLPKIEDDFSKAVEKKYSVQESFENIDAKLIIDITTLEKDSVNSVLKNVSITLLKGIAGYEFRAQSLGEQINHGTKKALNTSSLLRVEYYTESIKGQESGAKTLNIFSNGKVKTVN